MPRPARSWRAASMSSTTTCSPSSDPGSISVSPRPTEIDAFEPGGVSCTKRISSLTSWSWSALKPACT